MNVSDEQGRTAIPKKKSKIESETRKSKASIQTQKNSGWRTMERNGTAAHSDGHVGHAAELSRQDQKVKVE